jgi:hypothetical protein
MPNEAWYHRPSRLRAIRAIAQPPVSGTVSRGASPVAGATSAGVTETSSVVQHG